MNILFISYSHRDEELRQALEVHLAMLRRQGFIDVWHDRRIASGEHIDHAIDEKLEQADVVLLLVSPDFLASDYCYDVEVRCAMERHGRGVTRVIPVILRHCDWHGAPFGRLNALPKDGRPITKWPDRDEAFLDVVSGIKGALRACSPQPAAPGRLATSVPAPAPLEVTSPRSSNLRMRRQFTEADEDRFNEESFQFIALFFENSLIELQKRNSGITNAFKRVSAEDFTCVVYRAGKAEARCRIRFGGRQGALGGITYSSDDSPWNNSCNESLSVERGPHELYLRPLGMTMRAESREHLTQQGAAEYLWGIFVEPLQR